MTKVLSADVFFHLLGFSLLFLAIQKSDVAHASYSRRQRQHLHAERADAILSARRASDIAVEIAGENLIGALSYFKQAIKLEPENVQFRSNLGVTYMRIGLYHLADEQFRRALAIDPNAAWTENIEYLRQFVPHCMLTKSRKQCRLPIRQYGPRLHRIRPLQRVYIRDILSGDPATIEFASGNHPYVLVGAMEKWNLKDFNTEYLRSSYGEQKTEYYATSVMRSNISPIFVPMQEAIDDMLSESLAYKEYPGRYLFWNLGMSTWDELLMLAGQPPLPYLFSSDDKWLRSCFGQNDDARDFFMVTTHWRMLLIGTHHTGMFNHFDSAHTASWQAQLKGYKRWHLCSPQMSKHIGNAGEFNAFQPDYQSTPDFRKVSCFEHEIAPREILYYPHDWWHQVYSFCPSTEITDDISISLTGTIVNWQNRQKVQGELQRNCDNPKSAKLSLHSNSQTCHDLILKCFPQWDKQYRAKPTVAEVCNLNGPNFDTFQNPSSGDYESGGDANPPVPSLSQNNDKTDLVEPPIGRFRI